MSNDDLNTRLIFSASRNLRRIRPIARVCSRDSITQGPAKKRGGAPPPIVVVVLAAIAGEIIARAGIAG